LGSADGNRRADGVTYQAPSHPFESIKKADVDAAWQDRSSGNVISYVSDCQDPSDPPLDQIVFGVLAGVQDLKTETSDTITMQGREARKVRARGRVDGVPSGIELVVFKRNQCIYVLSHVSVEKSFTRGQTAFERFAQGFRAP